MRLIGIMRRLFITLIGNRNLQWDSILYSMQDQNQTLVIGGVGYFRKVNFILTYFDIDDENNCNTIEISHDRLHSFVNDLHKEIIKHRVENTVEPVNQKFKTKKAFFGGPTEYNNMYWENVESVYSWAKDLDISKIFNWNSDNLEMFFSW